MRRPALLLLLLLATGCAIEPPAPVFEASRKPATELRAMQTRAVPGDERATMRAVIATLHDLGYRITKADAAAGTVSATRLTGLRLAAVVRPGERGTSLVRANATVLVPGREAQVDDPGFYARNFFIPLQDTLGRELLTVPEGAALPEAPRPVAELMPGERRRPATGGADPRSIPDAGATPAAPATPRS